MRSRVGNLVFFNLVLLSLLAACTPAAPSPTVSPSKPAASPASRPAASPTEKLALKPEAKPSVEWERTVAAAKQEGKVVVYGISGADAQEALTSGFQKKYPEIQIDYTGAIGAQQTAKILGERGAGLYLPDLFIGGTTNPILDFIPVDALQAVQPFLVGPDAQDASKWRDGKFDFSDDAGKYNLVFTTQVSPPFAYNASLVPVGSIKSWKELLDPSWKNKLVMRDPRTAGAGLALATFWYANEALGKEFTQQLFAQEVVLSTDDRQIVDWVARGQYPIGLGASDQQATELKRRGVPIEFTGALLEGGAVSAGNGSVSVMNQAPHPNAAKMYLDWLLSQEAQTAFSRATGQVSRRLDVPTDHISDHVIPKPGVTYQANAKERYVKLRPEVDGFLLQLIRS